MSFVADLPAFILIAVALVIVIIVAGAIVAAPVLLAEVLLDALLVAGLWHRFKRYGIDSSLGAAARATVWPATAVVVCLGIIGYVLQVIEPTADSIGDFFRSAGGPA